MLGKSLIEVAKLLKKKELSPVELLEQTLSKIEETEKEIKAFITVTAELAKKQAAIAEKEILDGNYRGPLHGVPVSIKDLVHVKGVRTTNGSKIDKDFIARKNAKIIDHLLACGSVIVGKANLHEYANGVTNENEYYGFTQNPLNPKYTPGGSSGGSAASVAVGTSFASVGTDTGGSIRIPASCCGLVGLKPTYGSVNSEGVTPLAWSLDHLGPIAKTAKDAEMLLLGLLGKLGAHETGQTLIDEKFDFKEITVGLPTNYFFDHIDAEIERNIKKAIANIERMGAVVKEITLPNLDKTSEVYSIIWGVEAATFHQGRLKHHLYDFERDVARSLKLGELYTGTQYVKAQQMRNVIYHEIKHTFEHVDVILTPTLPVLPPPVGTDIVKFGEHEETILDTFIRYTCPFNITGFPAASIPVATNEQNLSTGMQIVADLGGEAKILSIAHQYLSNFL